MESCRNLLVCLNSVFCIVNDAIFVSFLLPAVFIPFVVNKSLLEYFCLLYTSIFFPIRFVQIDKIVMRFRQVIISVYLTGRDFEIGFFRPALLFTDFFEIIGIKKMCIRDRICRRACIGYGR